MWPPLILLGQLALGGAANDASAAPTADAPRTHSALPTAHSVGARAGEAYYRFHGAALGGRTLQAHQAGALLGLTEHLQIGGDFVDIAAKGRTPGNYLEAQGWGVSLKYDVEPWDARRDTALSLELEHRTASARAHVGDADAMPPDARVYGANAAFTTDIRKAMTLHARVSGSRLTLGSELGGWSVGGAAGVDYRFFPGLALKANAGVFRNLGDVGGTNVALSGGIVYAYGRRMGPFAGLTGTFWPAGVPVTGGPLADAAVFRMDPVVKSHPVGRNLMNATLGVATVEVGFRAQW